MISEYYRRQNRLLHEQKPGYGKGGARWISEIVKGIKNHSAQSVLDYGCGKNTLYTTMHKYYHPLLKKIDFTSYDPCIPQYSHLPDKKFDIVVCTDVLEHVEPEYLNETISHVLTLAKKAVFINVPARAGIRRLPDGSLCHKTVMPARWWIEKINHFTDWKITKIPAEKNWDINLWITKAGKTPLT